MRIKRAPLFGAIGFILITILILTGIKVSSCTEFEEPKLIIETTEEVIVEEDVPQYAYVISPEDREMLARLVFLEANTESLECQKAVASVVINRWQSGYWGNSLSSVIYAPYQFTPASRIPYITPTSTNYEAVDYVIQYGTTLPSAVLYFRANYHFKWKGYVPYISIDHTYFGYMAKDWKN